MPTLFVFLFKVNIALLLFCAGYYLVLRPLTFYSLNRVYLVTAIIFATLYPKIDLSGFAERHETLTKPVQDVVLIWQAPAQKLATHTTNYWQWAEMVFWAGAALLAVRLAVQLFSLFKLYRNSKPANILNHDVRLMEGDAAPFSFWRSIYVNPANHTATDLKAILLHEQVHVNGWHTIDILLAELSSIFYWFNPGIWLMKKAVRENIEFITDRKILNRGFDSKTYQYSLVNVSFNNSTPGIVNHFNISTIKKRIIMMNAKRSSRFKLTRYAFVVPAVVALLLVFTLSKADVAKPLTINLTNAIKPVTAVIKQVSQAAITLGDTAPAKKIAIATVKPIKRDTQRLKQVVTFAFASVDDAKADTGKKDKVVIKFGNNTPIDSMNIVLNGKLVDNATYSKVDPSSIESINVIKDTDMKRHPFMATYNIKNDKPVIFIATKDSEEGKSINDKLGASRITNIRINGVNKDTKKLTLNEKVLVAGLPAMQGKVSNVQIFAGEPVSVVNGQALTIVQGQRLQLRGKSDSAVAIVGYGTKSDGGSVARVYTNPSYATGKRIALNSVTYTGTDVNRISDKLMVIDGKEASEKDVKKLSAFDIDRVSVSSDADTIKKYGDKAKYGVVFIYTKKGK